MSEKDNSAPAAIIERIRESIKQIGSLSINRRDAWLQYGAAICALREKYDSNELFGKALVENGLDHFFKSNNDGVSDILSETKINDHVRLAAMWAYRNPDQLRAIEEKLYAIEGKPTEVSDKSGFRKHFDKYHELFVPNSSQAKAKAKRDAKRAENEARAAEEAAKADEEAKYIAEQALLREKEEGEYVLKIDGKEVPYSGHNLKETLEVLAYHWTLEALEEELELIKTEYDLAKAQVEVQLQESVDQPEPSIADEVDLELPEQDTEIEPVEAPAPDTGDQPQAPRKKQRMAREPKND